MYSIKSEGKEEDRRFKQFSDNFEKYKCISQSGNNTNYNIDLAQIEYINGDFINDINIAWITYKCIST